MNGLWNSAERGQIIQALLTQRFAAFRRRYLPFVYMIKAIETLEQYGVNYTVAYIPKKSGGYRKLYKPDERTNRNLKLIAKGLKCIRPLRDKIRYDYSLSRYGWTTYTAHTKDIKKKIKNFCKLARYRNFNTIIRLDIKQAFTRTNPDKIRRRLEPIKYAFVTKQVDITHLLSFYSFTLMDMGKVLDTIVKLCTVDNCLPTGFPTSNILFSCAISPLDKALHRIRRLDLNPGHTYPLIFRYVDDIYIACATSEVNKIISLAVKYARGNGYNINTSKIKVMDTRYGFSMLGRSCYYDNYGLAHVRPSKKVRNRERLYKHLHSKNPQNPKIKNKLRGYVNC